MRKVDHTTGYNFLKGNTMTNKILKLCNELEDYINTHHNCSAWDRGINNYAIDFIDFLREEQPQLDTAKELEQVLLNGAETWQKFSWGGNSLVCNEDIALRLCNQTELKRTNCGSRAPNPGEEWLDVQARALFQACLRLKEAFELIKNKGGLK